MDVFWRHAVTCRLLVQELATQAGLTPSSPAGFTGLLGDIGKLALAHLHPKEYGR